MSRRTQLERSASGVRRTTIASDSCSACATLSAQLSPGIISRVSSHTSRPVSSKTATTFLTSGSSVCAWLMKTFIIQLSFRVFCQATTHYRLRGQHHVNHDDSMRFLTALTYGQGKSFCRDGIVGRRAVIRLPRPNLAVEPTPYSVRCAPASGRGSPLAFGLLSLEILCVLLDSISGGDTIRVQYVNILENAFMQKKLTITLDETVYDALHKVIGRRRISRFIEEIVRPHLLAQGLEAAYQQMAQDETREAEALAWAEATVGDVSNEPR